MSQDDTTTQQQPEEKRDLDKAGILASKARTHRIERHFIPEWDGHVYIKTLTGTERDAFEESLIKDVPTEDGAGTRRVPATDNVRAKLLVRALCDKDGNAIFTDDEVTALGDLSANGLTRAYSIASKLNAVTETDVKELAKNSGRGAIAGG